MMIFFFTVTRKKLAMDIETAKALHNLREQNQDLFDKLRTNQTSVRRLLLSLRSNQNSTIDSDSYRDSFDSVITDELSAKGLAGWPSQKTHLYRNTSEKPKTNKSYDSDLTTVTDLTTTSTPVKYPRSTPKSILKGRQIIEDNVRVQSKYEHTPNSKSSANRRSLNFEYSEMDDIDMLKKVIRNQMEIDMALDESQRERRNLTEDQMSVDSYLQSMDSSLTSEQDASVATLVDRRLLTDTGNDRQHSAIIKELSKRPKSIVFDVNAPQGREDVSDLKLLTNQTCL